MLLPDNIKPENSIYYNGAIVLQTLQSAGQMNLVDLFYQVSEKKQMSYSVFILCLDWLYLINVAKLEGEEVVLCS
jgi:hypothetical protein